MGALLHGIGLNLSLLMSPGAQNMFVIEQSIFSRRMVVVCGISSLCDFVLISIGVFGLGPYLSESRIINNSLVIGGVAVLLWYGISALRETVADTCSDLNLESKSGKAAVITTLSFSLLNPSVYLDTIGLVGVSGSLYPAPQNLLFWLGAIFASSAWFFGLGFLGEKILGRICGEGMKGKIRKVAGILMMFNALMLMRLYSG